MAAKHIRKTQQITVSTFSKARKHLFEVCRRFPILSKPLSLFTRLGRGIKNGNFIDEMRGLRAEIGIRSKYRRRKRAADISTKPQPGIVVSLTSFPKRFGTIHLTLWSLLDQRVRPEKTVLWIAKEAIDLLPERVLSLREYGLEIRQTEEMRSYKKLLPSLTAFPEHTIVTVDDDVIYPPDWLEVFLEARERHPGCVVARKTRTIARDINDNLLPYKNWDFFSPERREPASALMPIGIHGVLYPPRVLPAITLNYALAQKLAPGADDAWFNAMEQLAGVDVTQMDISKARPIFELLGNEFESLWSGNEEDNDRQIRAIYDYFNLS
jgi:hypothetical protein